MLLADRKARLKWNSANKRRYVELGYQYTKMQDEFLVEIKDLTPTTRAIVYVQCDYCGDIVEEIYKEYNYLKGKTFSHKDTCRKNKCTQEKSAESSMELYGYAKPNTSPLVKAKLLNTIQSRYGEEYKVSFEVPEFKEKRIKTNKARYGVENVFSNHDIQNKIRHTNIELYGAPYYNQNTERRNRMSGKNHHNWNPDITLEERENNRSYTEYSLWRVAVYERDSYKCQCCGTNASGNLNAHHMDGYHWCKERRVDITNGVTLCEECHRLGENSFHAVYGSKNNTEEQFNEWIEKYQAVIMKERRIS